LSAFAGTERREHESREIPQVGLPFLSRLKVSIHHHLEQEETRRQKTELNDVGWPKGQRKERKRKREGEKETKRTS